MNKTIIVTGGTRGIGRACVELFSENMNVAFLYCHNDDLARELSARTGAVGYKVNVSDRAAVNGAVAEIYERFGSVDALVNNAGVDLYGMFQDITEAEQNELYGVNLFGTLNCTRAVVPYMVSAKRGSIVNVSSVWGRLGGSYEADYSAAKGAVIALTKSLARELGPSRIRVNCVSPGMIDTDMNASLSDEDKRAFLEKTALGRIGNADEVAKAIAFLIGDDSSYITGIDLPLDGLL